ncbi:MAG TPA: DUF2911 domain-containing protein [Puia sp.]|jgi:hypothetical protein|nr:DUF2911 domain-containing protein [Puia sp.]
MNMMKPFLPIVFFLSVSCYCTAQSSLPPLDKSPMDMCYYPVDYPVLKIQHKSDAPLIARVIYGRPQKNDRSIFGDLVPYDMIWRMGANEATEIEFFKDVKIDKNKIAKGRYTMYAIPSTDKWTIVLNKETDTWGAFGYDTKKDVIRADVKVNTRPDIIDVFTICFEGKEKNKTNLMIGWDNKEVHLPINW